MKPLFKISILFAIVSLFACTEKKVKSLSAKDILGNSDFPAICYGGFRETTRDLCPSVEEIKEDMKILAALNLKIIRTYNTQLFPHAERVLQAIQELKEEDSSFEMYVMLGAWIECEGAFTGTRDHSKENVASNKAEIKRAIELTQQYPDIVKIIAVGNESMVHWAETYSVLPKVVLHYVKELQKRKTQGDLDSTLWITSSDNFASWGGGSTDYHNNDLNELIKAVDYISMHTYPFHDTHYNPAFWQIDSSEIMKDSILLIKEGMDRAAEYAIAQFESTKEYVHQIAPNKPVHIGETGWACSAYTKYGKNGSHAADEYKQKLYYDYIRNWSNENKVSCFFFEAFDEPWKDQTAESASENHFGLININSEVKYVLWNQVDSGKFQGLRRNNKPLTKTFNGELNSLLSISYPPATKP